MHVPNPYMHNKVTIVKRDTMYITPLPSHGVKRSNTAKLSTLKIEWQNCKCHPDRSGAGPRNSAHLAQTSMYPASFEAKVSASQLDNAKYARFYRPIIPRDCPKMFILGASKENFEFLYI